ncbi:unnamed protein product [Caenorhabditis nigoni]
MYPISPLPALLGSLPLEEVYQGLGHGGLEGSLLGDSAISEEQGEPYAGLLALRDQHCPLVPEAEHPSNVESDVEKVQKASKADSAEKMEIENDPEAKKGKEDDSYDLLDELKTADVEEIIEEENFVVLFNDSITIPK